MREEKRRFARVLSELINENELTQDKVAGACGFDHVKISRLVNSVTRPTQADIEALFQAFTETAERQRLMVAHIQDEMPPNGLKLLQIEYAHSQLRETRPLSLDKLPVRVQSALKFLLRMHDQNPSIGDVFIDLATLLDWQEVTTQSTLDLGARLTANKAKSGKYPKASE